MGSSLKIIFDHFSYDKCFLIIALCVFLHFFETFISFRIFFIFYTKYENNHRSSSLGSD